MKLVLASMLSALLAASSTGENMRPVVGVLSQPKADLPPNKTSYIAASYVKFLEGSGARVVPILFDDTHDNIRLKLSKLNAILFPGGDSSLEASSAFFRASEFVFTEALKLNDAGVHFPVWGTCQGFEFINVAAAGPDHHVLTDGFDAEDLPLSLRLTEAAPTSRLLGPMRTEDPKLYQALSQKNITHNEHTSGVKPSMFQTQPKLGAFFKLLATNLDRNGREFASVVEGVKYPVYGTQFHPEKNNFEWMRGDSGKTPVPHGAEAVRMSQFFANFLVSESRMNDNTFTADELVDQVIYNYPAVFSAREGGSFEQVYYF